MTTTLTEEKRLADRMVLDIQQGLERLESKEGEDDVLQRKILADLEALEARCQSMERALRMARISDARGVSQGGWERKVENVQQRNEGLKDAFQRIRSKQSARRREEQEREALFHRSRGKNQDGFDPESGEPSTSDQIRKEEYDRNAHLSIQRSSRNLEETFAVGAAILSSMSDQRDRIKQAQRKALDVLHTVGLSDSLLRLIERRQTMDKIIVYGGMIALLLFVVLLWYWTR